MNAQPSSISPITSLTNAASRQRLSRECAARVAGHTVMAWRYDRLPANADAQLTRQYQQAVVDGWLQSGDLTATDELWMNLKIYVSGDVAYNALCSGSPQPRFAGAGLLAYLDIDDGPESRESFHILWHAADAEETLNRPVLRTALLQVFEALQREPALSAAEIKSLLSWRELTERYERDGARETLEDAAAAAGEDWHLKRPARRTAAE